MKKILLIFIVIFAAIGLLSCNSNNNNLENIEYKADDGSKVIYVNLGSSSTDVAKTIRAGMLEAQDEGGYYLVFQAANDADIEMNINYIRQAIGQKVDGMIIAVLDEVAYLPVLNEVADAGIPFVTVHSDAPGSDRKAYCGPNYEEYAEKAAYWMAEAIGYEGEVGIMTGAVGSHEKSIAEIFKETIEREYPGIEVVAEDGDTIDPAKAKEKVWAMVENHPELDGVFNTTAATVEQWDEIMEEKGLQDQLKVILMDTLPDQLECIRKGTIYGTISQGLYQEGYMAVKAVFNDVPQECQYVESEFVTVQTEDLLEKYEQENSIVQSLD